VETFDEMEFVDVSSEIISFELQISNYTETGSIIDFSDFSENYTISESYSENPNYGFDAFQFVEIPKNAIFERTPNEMEIFFSDLKKLANLSLNDSDVSEKKTTNSNAHAARNRRLQTWRQPRSSF